MKKTFISMALASAVLWTGCGSGTDSKASKDAKDKAAELLNELDQAEDEMNEAESADFEDFHRDAEEAVKMASRPAGEVASSSKTPTEEGSSSSFVDDEGRTVYTYVSDMPGFQGGEKELFKYLRKNLKYPSEAREKGESGKAMVQFTVTETGSVDHVEVVRSTGSEVLDNEAKRVVENMPAWMPGSQGGQPVNVRYTLPVNFSLQN